MILQSSRYSDHVKDGTDVTDTDERKGEEVIKCTLKTSPPWHQSEQCFPCRWRILDLPFKVWFVAGMPASIDWPPSIICPATNIKDNNITDFTEQNSESLLRKSTRSCFGWAYRVWTWSTFSTDGTEYHDSSGNTHNRKHNTLHISVSTMRLVKWRLSPAIAPVINTRKRISMPPGWRQSWPFWLWFSVTVSVGGMVRYNKIEVLWGSSSTPVRFLPATADVILTTPLPVPDSSDNCRINTLLVLIGINYSLYTTDSFYR